MTLEELYKNLDSDYNEALGRLMKPALIDRLLKMFLNDSSMQNLEKAMEDKNSDEAFRAVHTLKGVALNMGFSPLAKASCELTEILRGVSDMPECGDSYEKLCSEYTRTCNEIRAYVG